MSIFARPGLSEIGNSSCIQVLSSGAWMLIGRLCNGHRTCLVSLRVCSGPQQTRLFSSYTAARKFLSGFASTSKSSVCWDSLQALGVHEGQSESVTYYVHTTFCIVDGCKSGKLTFLISGAFWVNLYSLIGPKNALVG